VLQQDLARLLLAEGPQEVDGLGVALEVLQGDLDELLVAPGLLGDVRGEAVVPSALEDLDGGPRVVLGGRRGLQELLQGREVLELGVALQQERGVLPLGQLLLVQSLEVAGHVADPLRVQVALDDVGRLEGQPQADGLGVDDQRLVVRALLEEGIPVLPVDVRDGLSRGAALYGDLGRPLEHPLLEEDVELLRKGLLPELEQQRVAVGAAPREDENAPHALGDMDDVGELAGVGDEPHACPVLRGHAVAAHDHVLLRHGRGRGRDSPAQAPGCTLGGHRHEVGPESREQHLLALQRHRGHVPLLGVVREDGLPPRDQ